MFNLIKMNLYRMTHAVSTKVIALVWIFLTLFNFTVMKIVMDDPFNIMSEADKTLAGSAVSADMIHSLFVSSNFLIVLSVFVVLFANAEQKCGFDKNLIGITSSKWKHALARWISAVIGMTVLMAVSGLLYFGICALFLDAFTVGSTTLLLKTIALVYLGMVTFSGIFFFFTTLFRSSAGGLVPSLVISLGILFMIESLLDMLIKKIISSPKYLPSDFLFDSKFLNFDMTSGKNAVIFLAVLCVVYIALSVGGSMLLQQRRDVK